MQSHCPYLILADWLPLVIWRRLFFVWIAVQQYTPLLMVDIYPPFHSLDCGSNCSWDPNQRSGGSQILIIYYRLEMPEPKHEARSIPHLLERGLRRFDDVHRIHALLLYFNWELLYHKCPTRTLRRYNRSLRKVITVVWVFSFQFL